MLQKITTDNAGRSPTVRSRTTNDPRHIPGVDGRKREQRRRRDLIRILITTFGGFDAVSELQLVDIRKAAELTAAAETVRARLLGGDSTIDLSTLVKLEGEARRAMRAVSVMETSKPGLSLRERLAAEAGGAA